MKMQTWWRHLNSQYIWVYDPQFREEWRARGYLQYHILVYSLNSLGEETVKMAHQKVVRLRSSLWKKDFFRSYMKFTIKLEISILLLWNWKIPFSPPSVVTEGFYHKWVGIFWQLSNIFLWVVIVCSSRSQSIETFILKCRKEKVLRRVEERSWKSAKKRESKSIK